jgi:DNA-binding NtrC family response regulator
MSKKKVLFFYKEDTDDELCCLLRFHQWEVYDTDSVAYAQALLEEKASIIGLVLIESTNDRAYLDKVEELISHNPAVKWVLIMPQECMQDINSHAQEKKLINAYCYDFHTLPVDKDRLLFTLGHAYGLTEVGINSRNSDHLSYTTGNGELIGKSPAMLKLFGQIAKLSQQDYLVMIIGESGTGKELAAKTIHNNSLRARQPFVSINCESFFGQEGRVELFGYENGADEPTVGLIESAQGGTLFLKRIGLLPLERQLDFFHLIKEKSFKRVGGNEKIPLDIRIIVSNDTDLTEETRNGEFRTDFFFYLRMIRLEMPPLRQRDGDIMLLAEHFFKKNTQSCQIKAQGFSDNALSVMQQYPWPGNVRELRNCIKQAVIMSENRMLSPDDLALERRTHKRYLSTLEEFRAEADQDAIISAMRYSNYNVSKAAKILNISRVTLYCLIDKYNLRFMSSSEKPPVTHE